MTEVVRRVVAARVRDAELVEELTQETLVRVASARSRLDDEALEPYAIVTARNVVASHGRAQALHGRHVHRLVDYRSFDGPEQLALDREETDALAVALDQLTDADRELLLRHETEGVDLDTLADESATSTGAIAMRLARARAVLRLEFLLAFRRVELPTERCRSVLLAMSAGDRRRQVGLDSAGHLARCSTCRELAQPVSGRRRSIAGWLIVPAAEAVRRVATSLVSSRPAQAMRTSRSVQAGAAVAVSAAVVVGVVALRSSENTPRAAPAQTSAAATTTSVASRCRPLTSLDEMSPAERVGCRFASSTMEVARVPADEGFWVRGGSASTQDTEMWVRLVGTGESPVDVEEQPRVELSGAIREPRGDLSSIGLDPAGARRVERLGYYLEVDYADLAAG